MAGPGIEVIRQEDQGVGGAGDVVHTAVAGPELLDGAASGRDPSQHADHLERRPACFRRPLDRAPASEQDLAARHQQPVERLLILRGGHHRGRRGRTGPRGGGPHLDLTGGRCSALAGAGAPSHAAAEINSPTATKENSILTITSASRAAAAGFVQLLLRQ